jgi:hypothetical protein
LFLGKERGEASAMTSGRGNNGLVASELGSSDDEGFRDGVGGVTKDSAEDEGGVGDVAVLNDAGERVEKVSGLDANGVPAFDRDGTLVEVMDSTLDESFDFSVENVVQS